MQLSIVENQLARTEAGIFSKGLVVLGGVLLLGLLSQIKIYLPFTPVPVTGQTFGVTLVALCFGRKLAVSTLFSYLIAGFCGLPLFASAVGAVILGPTSGYLVGMLASAYVVGGLADRGYTRSLSKGIGAGIMGSLCVYACGLMGLAFFVKPAELLALGVLPFLPGDFIKTVGAAFLATTLDKKTRN